MSSTTKVTKIRDNIQFYTKKTLLRYQTNTYNWNLIIPEIKKQKIIISSKNSYNIKTKFNTCMHAPHQPEKNSFISSKPI